MDERGWYQVVRGVSALLILFVLIAPGTPSYAAEGNAASKATDFCTKTLLGIVVCGTVVNQLSNCLWRPRECLDRFRPEPDPCQEARRAREEERARLRDAGIPGDILNFYYPSITC